MFSGPAKYEAHKIEYRKIWEENKLNILKHLKDYTTLDFDEASNEIEVVLINGPSYSGIPNNSPMELRYNYSRDVKLSTLIHELSHRLIYPLAKRHKGVDTHSILFLFLYDIWIEMKGKTFADKMVEVESNRASRYKRIWNETLALSKRERKNEFRRYNNVATPNPQN